jgi:hypothetical protein
MLSTFRILEVGISSQNMGNKPILIYLLLTTTAFSAFFQDYLMQFRGEMRFDILVEKLSVDQS